MINGMEDKGINKRKDIGLQGFLFLLTIFFSAIADGYYQNSVAQMIGTGILAGIGFGSVLFLMGQAREEGSYLYDNGEHPERFACFYLISFAGSVLFPLLPVGGWPYLAVFVGMALFSNRMIGLIAGCTLLMITTMIKGVGISVFFLYFISGMVGIIVLTYVKETFERWMSFFVPLLILTVCLFIQEVLYADSPLSFQMFSIVIMNLLANLFLLLVLLKIISVFMGVNKNGDCYMEINDPEYPLLGELKELSEGEYFHAVHTAYLCGKTAQRLGLNDRIVKACGYYHNIGIVKGENSWENVRNILEENKFPSEVKDILKDYIEEKIVSKETAVLFFCDTAVSSISYLFSKDPSLKLDYGSVIGDIIDRKIESGLIDSSNLTFRELQEIKLALAEEKSYYDFLR